MLRCPMLPLATLVALPSFLAVPSQTGAWQATPDAGLPAGATAQGSCPYPRGVEIPGAAPYFVNWGLGDPRDPVWLAGYGSPPPSIAATMPSPIPAEEPLTAGPGGAYEPGYGWFLKALWVIGGGFDHRVTVTGANLDGGPPLAFELGDGPIVTTVVLDPLRPGIPVQHGDFREFPSYLFFPATGCYELHARWAGGEWRVRIPFVASAPPAATPIP